MSGDTEKPSAKRATKAGMAKLARTYFERLDTHDLGVYDDLWSPGAPWVVYGGEAGTTPDTPREFFAGMFAAIPDFRLQILDITAEPAVAVVHWRITGTFAGPGSFNGIEPNGARIELDGMDRVEAQDGRLTSLIGYTDFATFARQVGMLPPAGSPTDARMTKAFNLKTRLGGLGVGSPEKVADGVWLVRGGVPAKTMNVYLLEGEDGVVVFDAGIKAMTAGVAAIGAQMGGIEKLILGHAHADHRGIAPGLGVPVYVHEDDRADAEGDGGAHYFDLSKVNPVSRLMFKALLPAWDGGPVEIAGTLAEGDEPVPGWKVVHLPGHAPGLIGLHRADDGVALVSDCFYTLDPLTGRKGHARVPHAAFNYDTEQARASIRKLASIAPSAAYPGHAEGLTGDVAAQLETAAATT